VLKEPNHVACEQLGHKLELIYNITSSSSRTMFNWEREKNKPWNAGQVKNRTDPSKYKR
jgi:hypothetical protein